MIRSRSKLRVWSLADDLAVAQHGDAVGQLQRLLQRVADEDDGDPVALQPAHQIEEVEFLLRRQRRGRLVEDHQPRLVMDGACDLHQLLLAGAERGTRRHRIDVEIERQQEALGLNVEAAQPVEHLLVAQVNVLGHGHRRHQVGLLEHHGDALAQRVRRRGQLRRLAVEQHLAGTELIDAGQHLGQRRLAGAVLADDGVDLALLKSEVDVLDRRHAAEILGRALRARERLPSSTSSARRSRPRPSPRPAGRRRIRPAR